MSRAIAVARPSIESAAVVGQLPTRQSRKPRKPKLIDVPRQSKALPRRRPSSIVAPLGRLVSSRLTRRSHPDCRAIYRIVEATEQHGHRIKKTLEIDPIQAETVRQIFRLAREGDGSS